MGSQTSIARELLRSFIERAERLHEEKKGLESDLKDLFGEARSMGFDTKALKEVMRLRRVDPHDLSEFEAIVDTYKAALGMLPGFEDDTETEIPDAVVEGETPSGGASSIASDGMARTEATAVTSPGEQRATNTNTNGSHARDAPAREAEDGEDGLLEHQPRAEPNTSGLEEKIF